MRFSHGQPQSTLTGLIVVAAAQSGDDDSDAIAQVVSVAEVPAVAEVLLKSTT